MNKLSSFFQDKLIYKLWWAGLVLNLGLWSALRFIVPYTQGPLNLHYTIYFGIDRIGSWWEMWLAPLMGIIFHIANFILAGYIYRKDIFTSRLVAVLTVFIQLVVIAGGLIVALLNR